MKYDIVLTETAKGHYIELDARVRALIRKGLNNYLACEPMRVSRSRIKRLRATEHPEYRLRLDRYRVFYDVNLQTVVVLAIVPKDQTDEWLRRHGVKSS